MLHSSVVWGNHRSQLLLAGETTITVIIQLLLVTGWWEVVLLWRNITLTTTLNSTLHFALITHFKLFTSTVCIVSSQRGSSVRGDRAVVLPHLSYPGLLQLPLGVGLFVVQRESLPAGGRWRPQAGAVAHREAQRDEHPRSRVAVQERRGQPVVLQTRVLVDIANLEGSYEFPTVVQDADLIPLGETQTTPSLCRDLKMNLYKVLNPGLFHVTSLKVVHVLQGEHCVALLSFLSFKLILNQFAAVPGWCRSAGCQCLSTAQIAHQQLLDD